MNKKKVLFTTHAAEVGGAELQMIELCNSKEIEPCVLVMQNGLIETYLEEKAIMYQSIPLPKEITAFKRKNGFIKALKLVIPSIKMIKQLSRYAKNFDVIVCMSQKSFLLMSLCKPFIRKPIVWFMNDIVSTDHFSKTTIKIIVTISKFSADKIIVNSNASLEAWVDSGGKKSNSVVLYPGVSVNRHSHQKAEVKEELKELFEDQKPIVGIFGRLSSWKGQDVFLQAISKIPNVNAIIVGGAFFGEEKFEDFLIGKVNELSLSNRIKFLGHRKDVHALMNECDIIAHCSTSPEPFGMVIVEAMMLGTPVIASCAGGAREIITKDVGILTKLKDEADLVKAIKFYLENPKETKNMAENAKKRALENFTKEKLINNFNNIIRGL